MGRTAPPAGASAPVRRPASAGRTGRNPGSLRGQSPTDFPLPGEGEGGGSNLLPEARVSGRFGTFRQIVEKCRNALFARVFLRFPGWVKNVAVGFRDRRIQPLCHLSNSLVFQAISRLLHLLP